MIPAKHVPNPATLHKIKTKIGIPIDQVSTDQ